MFDDLKKKLKEGIEDLVSPSAQPDAPPEPDAATGKQLRALVEKGEKHAAYQLYRAGTGGDLGDAMRYVNALEARLLATRPDIRWGSEWLPAQCPQCGGALAPDNVEWLDGFAASARCPYCAHVLRAPEEEEESDDEETEAAAPAPSEPKFVDVSQTLVGVHAPQGCAYCQGRGRHFTDECPACGGQGTALAFQPAAPCTACGGKGNQFATRCNQCKGTGWERVIFLNKGKRAPKTVRFVEQACATCGGDGRDFATACPACAGKGKIAVAHPAARCANCDGRGKRFTDTCPACGGTGWGHHVRV